jgi:hypothetical protein
MQAKARGPLTGILAGVAAGLFLLIPLITINVLTWDQDEPSWPVQGVLTILMEAVFAAIPLGITLLFAQSILQRLAGFGFRSWWTVAITGYAVNFLLLFVLFSSFFWVSWATHNLGDHKWWEPFIALHCTALSGQQAGQLIGGNAADA